MELKLSKISPNRCFPMSINSSLKREISANLNYALSTRRLSLMPTYQMRGSEPAMSGRVYASPSLCMKTRLRINTSWSYFIMICGLHGFVPFLIRKNPCGIATSTSTTRKTTSTIHSQALHSFKTGLPTPSSNAKPARTTLQS